ncbi:hydantoinase/oxoprolinase family protein [Flavisphingomonas formosensis]|uniref:hydantoinase/oxoprolinase family protein n=1 Tax=Flavisphingomonas formosensis TaxID=861534 RepID=UPI0012FAF50E|nr:hydantoinase/oxoprolinase family protein [Sphingomonas formosensis]
MRVATDVGGTFTDLVCYDVDKQSGRVVGLRTAKTDTTYPQFDEGVMNAIAKAGLDPAAFDFFAHGTTVVINALLSRKGAKTGLITTKGFRDVLEIARGNRPDLFNLAFKKPEPFVPRYLRREVDERSTYLGEVLTVLDPATLDPILADFRAEGVEAIALCFLHAYVSPANEIAARDYIRAAWPNVSVIASHEISREWREYERTSTAVLTAYVHPAAKRYLRTLQTSLDAAGYGHAPYIMQSNGGIDTVEGAIRNPIAMVESGPASGVLGAAALGTLLGEDKIIALDIGGTTAKCSLIENAQTRITTEYRIEWSRTNPGYPIRTPVIEIVEIGNGGGSIAGIDAGGRLYVGPESAGASPGPAAYGRGGTRPTTTDANLVTGRINPANFLGGEITPDLDNVHRAFAPLVDRLDGDIGSVARGIIRIANANMVNALKLVSLNKGHDPRDFTLVAYGGGGAMHAVMLAEELQMPKVIIPVNSSVFSAWGMLMTDLRRDFVRTQVVLLAGENAARIEEIFAAMEGTARASFADEAGSGDLALRVQRYADMRYLGQEHSVKVELPDGGFDAAVLAAAIERFHVTHEREYTFRLQLPVEIVNFHVVALGDVPKHDPEKLPVTGRTPDDAMSGLRTVDFDEHGVHEARIYDRDRLEPGMRFAGPCIVEEAAATLVVTPGRTVAVDDYGNLHVHMNA